MYFRPKRFRTIFEKRTPIYSFAAPLLGLTKSIYYISYTRKRVFHQYIQATTSGLKYPGAAVLSLWTIYQLEKVCRTSSWSSNCLLFPEKSSIASEALGKPMRWKVLLKILSLQPHCYGPIWKSEGLSCLSKSSTFKQLTKFN